MRAESSHIHQLRIYKINFLIFFSSFASIFGWLHGYSARKHIHTHTYDEKRDWTMAIELNFNYAIYFP